MTTMRCRSSMPAAARSPAHRRAHRRRAARTDHVLAPPAAARSRSNAPTAPSSTRCSTAGLTVVVISPNQVKNLRGRYGSAGNKDDRFDAFVLADTLRTDRARLRPLVPDSAATVALRRACRARRDLVSPPRRGWPTSCARTCATCSPARSGCSPTSTPRSAWRSWPASTPRTAPTGSPRPAWARGWPASATPAGPTPPSCTPGCRRTPRLTGADGAAPRRRSPAHCSPS